MAEPVTPDPVSVAGLEIPADLAPQIITALRVLYPTVTEGKDDDAAVRAVLVYWIVSALEAHQGQLANAALEQKITAMRSAYSTQIDQAREKVRQAAGRIKEKTLPDEASPAARSWSNPTA